MEEFVKLNVANISKIFVSNQNYSVAIKDVSLDVKENEFLVLLGPGQCGKTVLLYIIAGLLEATTGDVFIDGEKQTGINSQIGFIFQDIGILPWLTVKDNVSLGLKFSGVPKRERERISQDYINLVQLTSFEDNYPSQLSGGMKQRVGIARAYANNSKIFLMDEPFGQLDAQTRYSMQTELLRIWSDNKRTVIFVTNNVEEALYLGDRIILFSKQPMESKEIYDLNDLPRPRNYTDSTFLNLRKEITEKMDLVLE